MKNNDREVEKAAVLVVASRNFDDMKLIVLLFGFA
jgi:hypothetical protein